jgi:hypothetical protein
MARRIASASSLGSAAPEKAGLPLSKNERTPLTPSSL